MFKIVVESLHAIREHRKPAVSHTHVQQMIRALDDEVRAFAADTIQTFVSDLSKKHSAHDATASPESLFEQAAKPFLARIWPQERSLSTPGVSRALADLPAAAGNAFTQAVDAIERFLVPFDSWSLAYYGLKLRSEAEGLSQIDSPEKAEALLRLLDRTIGTAEGTVVPRDLSDALQKIQSISPQLSLEQSFRRLATLSRT